MSRAPQRVMCRYLRTSSDRVARECPRHSATALGRTFAGKLAVVLVFFICLQTTTYAQYSSGVPSARSADRDAYYAYAAGNQDALAKARAAGGDAARFAKTDPAAIFDAMQEQRDPTVLKFVLDSGANPNADRNASFKGTPLLANPLDPDKIALLVKHGADINARDGGQATGYTALSHALFDPRREIKIPSYPGPGQQVRVFSKLDIVRLLLDAGAAINGNLGGWGREGALGLTRREDTDVIALLIARGATLSAPQPGTPDFDKAIVLDHVAAEAHAKYGPITLAVQLDRDDLALAILARDKLLAPNDGTALLEATRRGYSEVALALLASGANPNAVDDHGATPIAWAQRRHDTVLVEALRKGGASEPVKPVRPRYEDPALSAFDRSVARSIDEVAWFDPDRFSLSWFSPRQSAVFGFYGATPPSMEQVKCEQAVVFHVIAYANDQAMIQVGVCKRESHRIIELSRRAKSSVSTLITMLSSMGAKPEQWARLGLDWKHERLGANRELFTFPLIEIGHGIVVAYTIVLVDNSASHTVIVQADVAQLCKGNSLRTPLCANTNRALTDIATRVMGGFETR